MKKRLLSAILSLVFIVSLLPMGASASFVVANNEEQSGNQELLVDAYEHILATFSQNEEGKYVYPEEYAGAYIDGDKLYICVTEINDYICDKYTQASGNIDNIGFVQKENSLNYLKGIADRVRQLEEEIVSVSVIQKENVVRVGTNGNTEQVESKILASIPATTGNSTIKKAPIEVVEKTAVQTMPYTSAGEMLQQRAIPSLIGGIAISSNGYNFTLGICGEYNGNPAILTCGHSFTKGKDVTANGSVIGQVEKVNWRSGSYYDYAIIDLNTSAEAKVTNKVKTRTSTQSITSINSVSVEGMTVNRYGASTGFDTGTVLALDVSAEFDNTTIVYGLVEVSADSTTAGGDSGGPVYYGSRMYGTVTGHDNSSGVWYYSPSGAVPGFDLA